MKYKQQEHFPNDYFGDWIIFTQKKIYRPIWFQNIFIDQFGNQTSQYSKRRWSQPTMNINSRRYRLITKYNALHSQKKKNNIKQDDETELCIAKLAHISFSSVLFNERKWLYFFYHHFSRSHSDIKYHQPTMIYGKHKNTRKYFTSFVKLKNKLRNWYSSIRRSIPIPSIYPPPPTPDT